MTLSKQEQAVTNQLAYLAWKARGYSKFPSIRKMSEDWIVIANIADAALEALEEAQGKLDAVEAWSDKWPWSGLLGEAKRELDRILKEKE